MLLNLFQVPEDEADDVRTMLDEHGIPWYETRPNRWGFSHGGIWIADRAQFAQARALMDAYQHERRTRVRAEGRAAAASGSRPTFMGMLRRQPRAILLALVAALLALGLVLLPVWLLGL